jgi:hypothetical protein
MVLPLYYILAALAVAFLLSNLIERWLYGRYIKRGLRNEEARHLTGCLWQIAVLVLFALVLYVFSLIDL